GGYRSDSSFLSFLFRFCCNAPRRFARAFFRIDPDPVETVFRLQILQPLEQSRHRRAVASLGQQQELVAHFSAVERLLGRALEAVDMADHGRKMIYLYRERR